MQIIFQSLSNFSITTIDGKPDLELGSQIGVYSHGLKPTYGMTAEDMDFHSLSMSVEFEKSNTYKVLIRKNSTGETRLVDTELVWHHDTPDDWWWREGNFSCDCNRSGVFGDGLEVECSDGKYTVIHAVLPNGDIIKIDD